MFRRKLIIVILIIALGGAYSLIVRLRRGYVVPILMYHQILNYQRSWYRLGVWDRTFERQMAFLKRHRYNVLPLEEVTAMLKEKKRLPPKTVAITFDDGYQDNYDYAWPILKKYNLPATIFLIVSEVARRSPEGELERLDWKEIREMQDSGLVTFGSHALGPEPLIDLKSEEDLKKQIFVSKQVLEEKLGRRVAAFSYPEGLFDEKIKQLVIAAGYTYAVGTKPRGFDADDIFALRRLRISERCANMFIFWWQLSGYSQFFKYQRGAK